MKNNRVYMPLDAITAHHDFDLWYPDGDLFLSFKGSWETEKDRVTIIGRMGGEMGQIRPDQRALIYYLRLERWEYSFHTMRIFQQYFVKGMHWDIFGTLTELPIHFTLEDSGGREVRVGLVERFRNIGPCYEIWAKDVAKLRIAAAAVVSLAIKEHYVGLSEGILPKGASRFERFKHWAFEGRGKTYEKLLQDEAAHAARYDE